MTKPETQPLVSIGMPVYNGEKFIRESLDSLLTQNYKNFEVIISDNASEDATKQICLEYVSKDKRIRYYRNETNLGAAKNFNKVFELSYGKYFMWAADHDLWDKTFISRAVEIMNGDLSVAICYPQTMLIDLKGSELGITPDRLDTRSLTDPSQRFHETIWELTWCNIIYGLIRSSALRQTRLFVNVIGADNFLLAELSFIGTFAQISLPLFYRRENRPDENSEQTLKRHLKQTSPDMNAKVPYTLLLFNHLNAVMNAPIKFKDKVKLIIDVVYCFNRRFGVWKELLHARHLMGAYRGVRKIDEGV